MKQMLLLVGIVTVVHFPVAAAGEEKAKSPDLPGAKGPLFTTAGKLKGGVETVGADVADSDNLKTVNLDQQPKSRTLPRGVKVVVVYVKFRGDPDLKEVKLEIQGPDGRVEFKDGYGEASIFDKKTGFAVSTFMRAPKTGAFADGAYQAKVKSGDQVIGIINWQIGDPPK